MPRVPINDRRLTFDEYLEIEERAETRHEFVDGFMFAMAGSTKRHNLITSNIHSRLRVAARGTTCNAYMENIKLRLPTGTGYYPDVMVTCHDDITDLVVQEPCLLVEVLSESTTDLDHGEKWLNYQRLPSLHMYVMAAQDRRFVEVFRRQTDGSWRYETLEDTGKLEIACVNATMTLDDVYEDVIFEANKPD